MIAFGTFASSRRVNTVIALRARHLAGGIAEVGGDLYELCPDDLLTELDLTDTEGGHRFGTAGLHSVPTSTYGVWVSTRDDLIETTRALLWERGYVGTSPKAIQQRAGAGQGSMYHHFTGKHDLALAAIRRTAEELRALGDAELSAPGTALARITAYLRRERVVLKGCPIGRLTQDPEVMADPVLREPVEETFAWLRGRLAQVLDAGRENGEVNPALDSAATAATIVAVLQGGYVLARASGNTDPFDQAISGVLALLSAQSTLGSGRAE